MLSIVDNTSTCGDAFCAFSLLYPSTAPTWVTNTTRTPLCFWNSSAAALKASRKAPPQVIIVISVAGCARTRAGNNIRTSKLPTTSFFRISNLLVMTDYRVRDRPAHAHGGVGFEADRIPPVLVDCHHAAGPEPQKVAHFPAEEQHVLDGPRKRILRARARIPI